MTDFQHLRVAGRCFINLEVPARNPWSNSTKHHNKPGFCVFMSKVAAVGMTMGPCLSSIWPSAWGLPNFSCIQLLPGRHTLYLEDVDRCRCRGDSRDDTFDSRHPSSHADPNAFDLCLGIFWPMGIASWLEDGGCPVVCCASCSSFFLNLFWWRLCSRVVPWRNYHSAEILVVQRSNLLSWNIQTWNTYDLHIFIWLCVTLFHTTMMMFSVHFANFSSSQEWSADHLVRGSSQSRRGLVAGQWCVGKKSGHARQLWFGQQSQFNKSTKDLNLA